MIRQLAHNGIYAGQIGYSTLPSQLLNSMKSTVSLALLAGIRAWNHNSCLAENCRVNKTRSFNTAIAHEAIVNAGLITSQKSQGRLANCGDIKTDAATGIFPQRHRLIESIAQC